MAQSTVYTCDGCGAEFGPNDRGGRPAAFTAETITKPRGASDETADSPGVVDLCSICLPVIRLAGYVAKLAAFKGLKKGAKK